MTQSLLYIISNHSLDFSDKEKCIDAIKSQNIEWALEEYLFFVSHLTNTKPPKSQSVQLTQINHDEIWFLVNDIHIKIGKHIIQWKFPFIFRSFFDYLPLQKGVETLLATWFS
ncbi:MAG: hypothetical protein LBH82_06275, partial [Bacteroidales bacterium]|nr:hypothetical protein [Bacteroidales bacterium]